MCLFFLLDFKVAKILKMLSVQLYSFWFYWKSSFCLTHVVIKKIIVDSIVYTLYAMWISEVFLMVYNWTYPRILQHDRECADQTAGGIRFWESLWQPVCHAGFLSLTCRQSSPGTRCPWHQWWQGQVSVKRSWPKKKYNFSK